MKIIFSIFTLMHGGAERVVSNLANHMVREGHDVEILLYYDEPLWYVLDEKVKVVVDEKYIGRAGIVKHVLWRRKYFKKSNADVVVSFLATMNMLNLVSMIGVKRPIIVADRSDPRRSPRNKLIRLARDYIYRFADGVVLQNNCNLSYFSNAVQKKSTVIFNPTDVGKYKGSAIEAEKKKEIVYVGRLIESKNPLMLLEAFADLSNKYPEYCLTFYGDGEMKEIVEKRAEELGVGKNVNLPGAVHDVYSRINKAEIFVLPSNYEGMPNALMEAMCVGLPVISTKVSGAVDLIENGKNGILIECGNKNQLVLALQALLDSAEKRKEIAVEASHIAEKLTSKKIVGQWLAFIENVCEGLNVKNKSIH